LINVRIFCALTHIFTERYPVGFTLGLGLVLSLSGWLYWLDFVSDLLSGDFLHAVNSLHVEPVIVYHSGCNLHC